jgi:release factor glutamine methyltransferase
VQVGGVNEPQLVAALRAAGCVFAEEEARLLLDEASSPGELMAWAARRMAGEPLEYVVGWAEFAGVRVAVDPGVFVPRRRSELLVAVALREPADLVVDLCCGTAAFGAALSRHWPGIEVHAADADPAAVVCARRNLPPERVHEGDLYAALPAGLQGRVDLVVANAPYVPTDAIATMPRDARDHEHRVALDGGADGLDVVRRVVAGAPEWLRTGGRLVVETGRDQADDVAATCAAAGLSPSVESDDEIGGTVVLGRRISGDPPGSGIISR